MHQDATHGVHSQAASIVLATVDLSGSADRSGIFSLKREFCRVVEHQNPSLRYSETIPRRLEMARKDLLLADSLLGEESVSGLGVGPVLAGHGDGFADALGEPFPQAPEPLSQTYVLK